MLSNSFKALTTALVLLPAAEALAVDFSFTYVDNDASDFASRGWLDPNSLFQRNIRAAGALWSRVIDSDESLVVEVQADSTLPRFGGTFTNGRYLGDTPQGALYEPAPLSVVLTGAAPAGPPHLIISVNADYLETYYWLDPTPGDRTDETPPFDKTDLVSIAVHEMGHGLGYAGRRIFAEGPDYGAFFTGALNLFDLHSYFGGNGDPLTASGDPNPMSYSGVTSSDIYTGPVALSHVGPGEPLHSQDFYHLGTCGDAPILTGALMNGCSVPTGSAPRLTITPLDLALLVDMGYPSAVTGECDAADGLDEMVANDLLAGADAFETCRNLTVGPGYTVLAGADLTLRSGKHIALGSGFSVQEGGTLSADTDRLLRAMP
ncbi:hypothetical protein [Algiphilus sp.]|uniref:hypothetical protein n=1 Tax=Algiphilus sp. TaxID=1872431 RepID=UPI003C6172DD